MNEKFSKEVRQEALKLAEEIGTAAACQIDVYDYIENDLLPLFVKQIISQHSLFE